MVGLGKKGIILFSTEFQKWIFICDRTLPIRSLLRVFYQREHGVCVHAVPYTRRLQPGPYLASLTLFWLALACRQLFGIPTKSPPIRAVTPQIFQEP